MACGGGLRASGKDKGAEWFEAGVVDVGKVFEFFNVFPGYAGFQAVGAFVGTAGKISAEVEEFVLDVAEVVGFLGRDARTCGHEPYHGVEFVDCSVGFYSYVVFLYSLASYQGCHAAVASACVNVAFFHDDRKFTGCKLNDLWQ